MASAAPAPAGGHGAEPAKPGEAAESEVAA